MNPIGKTTYAVFLSRRKILGPLGILVGVLLMSAVVRLAISADAVIAATTTSETGQSKPVSPATAPENPLVDVDLQRVLDALRHREAKVATLEVELEARTRELKTLEEKILAEQVELEQKRTALEETMALADSASENDLKQLTLVYERMKPKNAAKHFEAMKPDFAAGFLGRMKPNAAADIMAQLDPQFAYAVTAVLAGRNSEAGIVSFE